MKRILKYWLEPMTKPTQPTPPQPYLEKWDQMIVEKKAEIDRLKAELTAIKKAGAPHMTTQHTLKIWPEYFFMVEQGIKPFEIRNDDRNFKEGDTIEFQEWNPSTGQYTGRKFLKRINFILRGSHVGAWGLKNGFCAFGLEDR